MLKRVIPLVADTGCPYIVICGGNYHPSGFNAGDARNFTHEALERIAAVLGPLLKLAEAHGAKLSIEPYIKTAVHSPETFLTLKRLVNSSALRVNVDVTSFYGLRDLLHPTDTALNICEQLAGHYGLGHIKDLRLEEGFHMHAGLAPLGASPTDWVEVLK